MPKIPVAVLGATGSVGQRFVSLLDGHPWFEVALLTGSERSAGRTYAQACRWILDRPMPAWAADMQLVESDPHNVDLPLVFSALPSGEAREIEPAFARSGTVVCSNASAYRDEPDVAILLPEVNPEHAAIVERQRQERGWRGAIVTNSNCTSTGMSVALKALQDAFGVGRVFAVSMQAVSGAGYPGVASLDILDNVVPYIGGEEPKVESESRKILGTYVDGWIVPADLRISAHANRVHVSDGHMVCLSVELGERAEIEAVREALQNYAAPEISADLPSTPDPVIILRDEKDRPQPRLDRWSGAGMSTVVGRVRPDPLFDVKLVVLSHNTVRGAAGGSIYNAELLLKMGTIS